MFSPAWRNSTTHLVRVMSTDPLPRTKERRSRNRPALRPLLVVAVLGIAAFIGLLFWPSDPENSPYDLRNGDGKPRFYATTFSEVQMPPNLSLRQRLYWSWLQQKRRHGKRHPAAYSFPAREIQPWQISDLLTLCMEISGTRYLIAVEIAGQVEVGSTNALNGAQWVAACEHAIETSKPVICYDWAKHRNFQDTLLLIRERPGLVKVLPRTKLAEYQKAGLVKAGSR